MKRIFYVSIFSILSLILSSCGINFGYDSFSTMIDSYQEDKIRFYEDYEDRELKFRNVLTTNYNKTPSVFEKRDNDSIFSMFVHRVVCNDSDSFEIELNREATISAVLDRVEYKDTSGIYLGITIILKNCLVTEYTVDFNVIEFNSFIGLSKSELLKLNGKLIEIEGYLDPIIRFSSIGRYVITNVDKSLEIELDFYNYIDFNKIELNTLHSPNVRVQNKVMLRGIIKIDESFKDESYIGEIEITHFEYVKI